MLETNSNPKTIIFENITANLHIQSTIIKTHSLCLLTVKAEYNMLLKLLTIICFQKLSTLAKCETSVSQVKMQFTNYTYFFIKKLQIPSRVLKLTKVGQSHSKVFLIFCDKTEFYME